MKITIDKAQAADLDAMSDLLDELFTLESDFKPDREKQRCGLRLILDNPSLGQLFVLRLGGQMAGMANALITVSTAEGCRVVLLEDLIIKAEYRQQKLGQQLIEHVLQWASANGFPRVTLLADQVNARALSFYAQRGFEPSAMRVLRKKTTP